LTRDTDLAYAYASYTHTRICREGKRAGCRISKREIDREGRKKEEEERGSLQLRAAVAIVRAIEREVDDRSLSQDARLPLK